MLSIVLRVVNRFVPRSCRPRSLGRGSDRRIEEHLHHVMLAMVPDKKTETVVNALIEQAHQLPTELYQSLDLGSRSGNGGSQAIHPGDKHCRLFLRPTESMAARIE